MKILVLGATGMLGNAVFRVLSACADHEVVGSVRGSDAARWFPEPLAARLLPGVDIDSHDSVIDCLAAAQPDVVVNCIGLVKQLAQAADPLQAVPLNALLPHRLARLCALRGARLVQISTDCVFSGGKGGYTEADPPDAQDLYGRSKLLGEVDYPHAVTLRTSIIGHELDGHRSLLCWFLAQPGPVKGYRKAIFSGLPTVELAHVIRDHVLPRADLRGLYHVAAEPIDKARLLGLIAAEYGKQVEIVPSDEVAIDRSLDASRFAAATGYRPPPWPELVARMRAFH